MVELISANKRAGAARGFRGIDLFNDPMQVMASPPTITVGAAGAVSAITGNANSNVSISPIDPKITWSGGPGAPVDALNGYYTLQANGQALRSQKIRFQHFGRRFEFRTRTVSTTKAPTIRIDGKLVSADFMPGLIAGSSADQLVLVDFGANTETIGLSNSVAVAVGGAGYAVNDVITVVGGTGTAATVRVAAVSAGVPTSLRLDTRGAYSAAPASPAATTGGSGTGLTISFTRTYYESTIKPRCIEIIMPTSSRFGGINVDTNDDVYPWPEPASMPIRTWIGDSYIEGLYGDTFDGNYASQAARRLGDCVDRFYGYAGMGFAGSPTVATNDLAIDEMVRGVDRIVYALGTNDNGSSPSGLTSAVTARLNRDLVLAPNGIITLICGFKGVTSTEANAYAAGVAACIAPARVGFVDAQDLMKTPRSFRTDSDTTHPTQNGHNGLGRQVAVLVAASEAALMGV